MDKECPNAHSAPPTGAQMIMNKMVNYRGMTQQLIGMGHGMMKQKRPRQWPSQSFPPLRLSSGSARSILSWGFWGSMAVKLAIWPILSCCMRTHRLVHSWLNHFHRLGSISLLVNARRLSNGLRFRDWRHGLCRLTNDIMVLNDSGSRAIPRLLLWQKEEWPSTLASGPWPIFTSWLGPSLICPKTWKWDSWRHHMTAITN